MCFDERLSVSFKNSSLLRTGLDKKNMLIIDPQAR